MNSHSLSNRVVKGSPLSLAPTAAPLQTQACHDTQQPSLSSRHPVTITDQTTTEQTTKGIAAAPLHHSPQHPQPPATPAITAQQPAAFIRARNGQALYCESRGERESREGGGEGDCPFPHAQKPLFYIVFHKPVLALFALHETISFIQLSLHARNACTYMGIYNGKPTWSAAVSEGWRLSMTRPPFQFRFHFSPLPTTRQKAAAGGKAVAVALKRLVLYNVSGVARFVAVCRSTCEPV